jgi:hypothetical protein
MALKASNVVGNPVTLPLVSFVVSGREASSFRHVVLGLHASGAKLPLFEELHVLHGSAQLVFYSMLRLSGHSA